jgi:hypothetical protein
VSTVTRPKVTWSLAVTLAGVILAACAGGSDDVKVGTASPAPGTNTTMVQIGDRWVRGRVVGEEISLTGAWVNGKGYIMKHRTTILIDEAGSEMHVMQPLSPEDQAKIPAHDPALDRPATPAEQAAFQAAVEAENARYQGPSLGLPPGPPGFVPPEPPPGPEQVYVPTPEQVAAHDNWTPPPVGEVVTVWEPPPGLR